MFEVRAIIEVCRRRVSRIIVESHCKASISRERTDVVTHGNHASHEGRDGFLDFLVGACNKVLLAPAELAGNLKSTVAHFEVPRLAAVPHACIREDECAEHARKLKVFTSMHCKVRQSGSLQKSVRLRRIFVNPQHEHAQVAVSKKRESS